MQEVPGLIALGRKYSDAGLRLLFFPCNQFCSEEPDTAAEIAEFYVGQHGLPASSLMERADVNGPHTQPVYKFLRSGALGPSADGAIEWNFTKFVIGRDGQVLKRYGQDAKPQFFDEQLPGWLA